MSTEVEVPSCTAAIFDADAEEVAVQWHGTSDELADLLDRLAPISSTQPLMGDRQAATKPDPDRPAVLRNGVDRAADLLPPGTPDPAGTSPDLDVATDAWTGPAVLGTSCAGCGRRLVRATTGRRRRFCSDTCRQAAYRTRRDTGTERRVGGWATPRAALYTGNAATVLAGLPAGSVHCVVSSPPYFGLRDYHHHPDQIGVEATVADYVDRLVQVLRQVRRVLRADGTVWLNLGDTYAGRADAAAATGQSGRADRAPVLPARVNTTTTAPYKSLLGIPWRVATALTDDRWVLRNDIIWHKPNGLPHSGTDRLANRHEHLFLFTPTPRGYHFDLQPLRTPPRRSAEQAPTRASHPDGANPGDVWTISATPAQPGHTAGYPAELARRAITAGSPPDGVVLDFCSGTATTGAAALELGRRYIGIELHQPDNAAAARRLARLTAP